MASCSIRAHQGEPPAPWQHVPAYWSHYCDASQLGVHGGWACMEAGRARRLGMHGGWLCTETGCAWRLGVHGPMPSTSRPIKRAICSRCQVTVSPDVHLRLVLEPGKQLWPLV
ncbi:unnamed protein product [Gadus morhua 'NCC']